MFNLFKKKKMSSSDLVNKKALREAKTLEPDILNRRDDTSADFMDVYLQTTNPPLGDRHEAWNWVIGKLKYFKSQGQAPAMMRLLEENIILGLTDMYLENFSEYSNIADDLSPAIIACEKMLGEGNVPKAKAIAEPYIKIVVAMKDELIGKQRCIQSKAEAYLAAFDFPEYQERTRAKDNYTYLLVLYSRILEALNYSTKEELMLMVNTRCELLMLAKDLSPWNSSVWLALARFEKDERKHKEYTDKAFRYCFLDSGPYGLGEIYGHLAQQNTSSNPLLAKALCIMARKYDCKPISTELLLSRVNGVQIKTEEEAISVLKSAGIQIGYSAVVQQMFASYPV